MVEMRHIRLLSERIAQEFQPERIVLFGSYANGTSREDSDVDLLVVLPFQDSPIRKAVEIVSRVSPLFAVDLLARTPEQVKQRLEWNDFFLRDILHTGITLYAASDAE